MTAVPRDPRISELRELFKHFQEFRSVYEETGLEEIKTPMGNTWSIWDLEYLYRECRRLKLRQRQAITLCLVHGMREKDAALAMGVSETNPVMMYATLGLRRLLDMIEDGELDRFRERPVTTGSLLREHVRSVHGLAGMIKSRVRIVGHDCWILPGQLAGRPARIRIPTRRRPSGVLFVDPVRVMYEAHVGAVPPYFELEHPPYGRFSTSCLNPGHPELVMTEQGRKRQQALLERYLYEQGRAA